MKPLPDANRRTVLRGIGAGVGGMALTGITAAEPRKRGQHHSYAWANGEEWDMLEPEPPDNGDNEGNESAHRPLWVIADTGLCHSPHPNPDSLPIQHVIPLGPHGIYTAQWHVHLVTDGEGSLVNTASGEATTGGACDDYLLSAGAIEAADGGGVTVVPTETVFTCPARPGSCTDCTD